MAEHPFKSFRKQKITNSDTQVDMCAEYLKKLSFFPCKRLRSLKTQTRYHPCRCLQFLADETVHLERLAIARYMVYHYNRPFVEKERTLLDWIRYTQEGATNKNNDDNKPRFLIPFIPSMVEDSNHSYTPGVVSEELEDISKLAAKRVCKATLGAVLDFSYDKWIRLKASARANEMPRHGLQGKKGNCALKADVHDKLKEYLQKLSELAAPRTTRIVRQEIGIGLTDGEEGVVELPPHFSRRQLYYRYVTENGWDVTLQARGNIKMKEKEGESNEVCSFQTFLSVWKRDFPKLLIRAPSEDICTACHVFLNRWRYLEAQPEEEPVGEEAEGLGETPRSNRTLDVNEFLFKDAATLTPKQNLLREAFLHVKRSQSQRLLSNDKIKEARQDYLDKKPHSESRRCIVVDYSQNAGLPQLGSSQPGRSYYYTPLFVYIFGIVNCDRKEGVLDAYVYDEGQGKKGGNNVSSMLMDYLQKQGWLQENVTGKELTIIMDNCVGQNKNNTVLRLAPLLVELGFFETVTFMFYVVGHTKNACDRWFNTLKRAYRKSDIWTMPGLIKLLDESSESVTIRQIKSGDFKNWDCFLDSVYNKIAGGKVTPGHIFVSTIKEHTKSTMTIWEDKLNVTKPHIQEMNPILAKKRNALQGDEKETALMQRQAELKDMNVPVIPDIGIGLQKRMELGTKWRELVPDEFKDILCPLPTEEQVQQHKENIKAKKAAREQLNATGLTTEASNEFVSPLSTRMEEDLEEGVHELHKLQDHAASEDTLIGDEALLQLLRETCNKDSMLAQDL